MRNNAINAFRQTVAKLHPLSPLSKLELAVEPDKLTIVKRGKHLFLGIIGEFPAACAVCDLLDALDSDAEHLERALNSINLIASKSSRWEVSAAFTTGFDALSAFMGAVEAASEQTSFSRTQGEADRSKALIAATSPIA
ncbi:hypothetical protein J2Y63_004179 [Shinella sp. BE166]|uniref:hypothetical protein n=1 Tax=Shinella sp. BE166 TaxID=3373918 RepID=UPI003EB8A549